jgi:preprotein translocase subunit SecD
VQSAPAFQTSTFDTDVVISGDFSRTEADDLARLLRYGALPVRFDESQQTVENVSPTLGRDQLRAGITAGLIGIALVFLYMFVYYRILALVVVAGLGLTAAGTYALVSYLGDSIGLVLTLAGVTGLIVSVGVTVDSYIVYFERLKDEVRSGKTVRSSVDRGFVSSFRTILAADLVSLIGAAVLYLLAIGSVRGFAFFLGLATLLDLAVTYFFMHPLVVLIARRPGLLRARYVGIASGLDAAEVKA